MRPRQIFGAFGIAVLVLILLMASVVAGGAAARSANVSGLAGMDSRRTEPLILEPTDSSRKIVRPIIAQQTAPVAACAGEGLSSGSDMDTAVEVRAMIQAYCYPQAQLAGGPDDATLRPAWRYGLVE